MSHRDCMQHVVAAAVVVALFLASAARAQGGPGPIEPPGGDPWLPIVPPGAEGCPCWCPEPPVSAVDKFFCGGLTCEDLASLTAAGILDWIEEHCVSMQGREEECMECVEPRLKYFEKKCECENDTVICDQDFDSDVDCDDIMLFVAEVKHKCITRQQMLELVCCFLQHVNRREAPLGCDMEFAGGCAGLKTCLTEGLSALPDESKVFDPPLTPSEVDGLLACYGCDCCHATPHGASYLDCGGGDAFACDRDGDSDVDCADFHSFLQDSMNSCMSGAVSDEKKLDLACVFIQHCAVTAEAKCTLAALILTCLERELCRPLSHSEIELLEACAGESCDLGSCCATVSRTGSGWGEGGTSASYSKCGGKIRCDQDCDGTVDCADFQAFVEESRVRCNGGTEFTHKQVLALACAFLSEGQCGNQELCGEVLECIEEYLTEHSDPHPEPEAAEVAALADCMTCGSVCDIKSGNAKKGHGSKGCGGRMNPKTGQNVDAQSGHATAHSTDVKVRSSGPGAVVARNYSSNPSLDPACDTGSHWSLSTSQHVSYNGGTQVLTLNVSAELRIEVDVSSSAMVTDTATSTSFWRVPGDTTQVVQKSLATYGGATFAVWRVREPGAESIDFYRTPDVSETSAAAVPPGLEGLVAGVTDSFTGNRSVYQYSAWAGLSGFPTARLAKIHVNPTTSLLPPAATVEFTYSMETEGNQGRLRTVTEYRYDASGNPVPVQRVTYKYAGDIGLVPPGSTLSPEVGTDGDLVLMIQAERVDPMPGSAGPIWRERVTHYRYHGNTSSVSGLAGSAHQLKMIVEPEQMEFAASASVAGSAPDTTVPAYAIGMLSLADDAAAWTGGVAVIDLAAQVFAAYDAGATERVAEVWMQSGCGCGGTVTKRKYAYHYDASTASYSTLHVDETPGATPTSPLRRYWFETYAPAGTGVHYLRSEAVEELDSTGATTHRAWINWYDFDSTSFVLLQERSPATFPNGIGSTSSYDYQPGTSSSPPVYSTSATAGLSHRYTYAGSGDLYAYKRLATVEAGQGASPSTWTLIESRTYGDADGAGTAWDSANSRTHLLSRLRRYRTAGGAGSSADDIEETRYFYGFTTGTGDEMAWLRTDVEAELTAENGPGGWYSTHELYDSKGRNVWSVAADMSVTKRDFAAPTGYYATDTGLPSVVTRNSPTTGLASTYFGLSTSGFGRSGDGGALVTTYRRDLLGRIQDIVSPGGATTHILRHMHKHPWLPHIPVFAEVTLPHQWTESSQLHTAGAAQVSWLNAADRPVGTSQYAVAQAAYGPGSSASWPMGVAIYVLGTELGRQVTGYRYNGLVEWQGYWTALASSEAGAPYGGSHATYFYYDDVGRLLFRRSANDTVTQYEYDVLDRVVRTSTDAMGSATHPSALAGWTATMEYGYDGGSPSAAAIGDGNLTAQTALVASGLDRTTTYTYDFRNRRIRTQNPAAPHEFVVYDNLDRAVQRGVFSSVPTAIGTTLADRGLYTETAYSQRGLVYCERTATVPTSSSPVFLETNRWFDEAGRVVGTWAPTSPGTKTTFDGLGRVVAIYIGDRGGDAAPGASGNYADVFASHASVLASDVVLEERRQAYSASTGLPTLATLWRRAHNATATGAVSGYAGGDAAYAIPTYSAVFHDAGLRPIRQVDYGTNLSDDWLRTGGSAPSVSGTPPDWNSSGNQIVSETRYDSKGRVDSVTDPTGRVTKYAYDMADRRIATFENWDSGNPPELFWNGGADHFWGVSAIDGATPDVNRATTFVYNGVGATERLTAYNYPDGATLKLQHTTYRYGVTKGTGAADSALSSNDLLGYAVYPNDVSGLGGTPTYYAAYAYNLQGEAVYMEEGKGTAPGSADFSSKHEYTRDAAGRVTVDLATDFGADIDSRVNALTYAFDSFGRLASASSRRRYVDASDPGTATDEVAFAYSRLWQVERVDQNPVGALTYGGGGAPSGFTRRVSYRHDTQELSGGTRNFSRMDRITYPDGSVEDIAYGSSSTTPDARISRATALSLDSTAIVAYDRVGLDTFAVVDYRAPNVKLDRHRSEAGTSAAGHYPGLDRFGRVRRQMWVDDAFAAGSGGFPNIPPVVSTRYGYTKASDRISAVDDRPGAGQPLSNEYEYDGLHRLVEARQGAASGGAVPIGPGSQRWREDDGTVTLDALGNWRRSWTELDGNAAFDDATERDDRTHDLINRTVGRTLKGQGSGGGGADLSLGDLQYDLASNLSLWKRQGGTSAVDIEAVHDAWNRLVDVSVGGVLRAHESHNALHWRTYRFGDVRSTLGATPDLSPDGTLDQARLMYYGQDWRLLEERIDDDFDLDDWKAETFDASDIDRVQQYVWGLRYVDDIVLHRIDANADGDYADAGDSTWHHLTDAQFSTVAILDRNGAVAERVSYSAYGTARHRWPGDVNGDGAVVITGGGASDDLAAVAAASGSTIAGGSPYRAEYDLDRDGDVDAADQALVGSAKAALPAGQLSPVLASGPDNPVGWDGYLYSPETALYEVRFRVYEPGLGRWMELDPAEYVQGRSLFQYVGSAPQSSRDPFGACSAPPAAGAAIVSVGAGGAAVVAGCILVVVDSVISIHSEIEIQSRGGRRPSTAERRYLLAMLDRLKECPSAGCYLDYVREQLVEQEDMYVCMLDPTVGNHGLTYEMICGNNVVTVNGHIFGRGICEEAGRGHRYHDRLRLLQTMVHESYHHRCYLVADWARGLAAAEAPAYDLESDFLDALYRDVLDGQCLCDLSDTERDRLLRDLNELARDTSDTRRDICGHLPRGHPSP